MEERVRKDFCTECRRETEYNLTKKEITKTIKGRAYSFNITVAVCTECGAEMNLPGLIDKNIQEIDDQYRMAEDIVTIDDINKLMKIYNIGKAPLSLSLGFGEITITRYLEGQIPSKEYSDIIKSALSSPKYMKKCLMQNKEKIATTAYNKAMEAASKLERLFCVSSKMLQVISYLFESLEEVTPLMLQKLLYFTQGIYLALYGKPIFSEDCEAWIHGPVYAKVYTLFNDFKYNPIDDDRFVMLEGYAGQLEDEEKEVIDLVVKTFGLYGGKTLERITHNERPWMEAREGYSDEEYSHVIISKDSMKEYYEEVNKKYGLVSEVDLLQYIKSMLQEHPYK